MICIYILMINLIGLALHMVWYINTCGGLWFNGLDKIENQ